MFLALAIAVASLEPASAAAVSTSVTATVRAASTIPDRLVDEALQEAAAIWQLNGVTLVWRTGEDGATGSAPSGVAFRVTFDDRAGTSGEYAATLGSIVFVNGVPLPDIRLSYANALELLRSLYGNGQLSQMTTIERRMHLSRALGRALAHEVGHYLLASPDHTSQGLMKARQIATDLFGPSRRRFELTDAQRCHALAHVQSAEHVARR